MTSELMLKSTNILKLSPQQRDSVVCILSSFLLLHAQFCVIAIISISSAWIAYLCDGTQGWVGTEEGKVTDNDGHRLIFAPGWTTVDWSRLILVVRFAGPAVLVLEILSCLDTCQHMLPNLDFYLFDSCSINVIFFLAWKIRKVNLSRDIKFLVNHIAIPSRDISFYDSTRCPASLF